MGLPSCLMAKAVDAVGHEEDDGNEDRARNPERDDDRVVDVAPVRSDRRPPPGADEVEDHRADSDQNKYERYSHSSPSLPREAVDLKQKAQLNFTSKLYLDRDPAKAVRTKMYS
jgi:hypothetical protein